MTTINTILSRIESLDINKQSQESIEQTKQKIIDVNKERMAQGRRADGSYLPNYSRISVEVYGYPPGPWRLKNTGKFQQGITVNVDSLSFKTDSTDEKSAMLKKKAGEGIFGMDKEGKVDYVKVLQPVLVSKVKKILL